MPFTPTRPLRALATAAVLAYGLGTAGLAQAANHALILWIGDYGHPKNDLPGIDKDAAMARDIALGMGVPAGNIRELSNRDFTRGGIARAFSDLAGRIGKDDSVFIYYSGHGDQRRAVAGSGCTEGMVTREGDLYEDSLLQDALTTLGSKASQVVMMNDSCFSGGAATKSLERSADDEVPKFYTGPLPASANAGQGHHCGDFVNKVTRNLRAAPRPPQVLYIAAAAANEVSFATQRGSTATLAWQACLKSGDTDNSGAVDGNELAKCAQNQLNQRPRRQTVTLVGNSQLPLSFSAGSAGGGSSAAVNPARTLDNLRAMRDPSAKVVLTPARRTLRIGQDLLDFNVSTDREGYLYVLHVGSDGKTFDQLFPNASDRDNFVAAGTHRMPRPAWSVQAAGPAGTSYLMAVVSPVPRDFTRGMNVRGTFAHSAATFINARNLVSVAAGANAPGARLGMSEVVSFTEAP